MQNCTGSVKFVISDTSTEKSMKGKPEENVGDKEMDSPLPIVNKVKNSVVEGETGGLGVKVGGRL